MPDTAARVCPDCGGALGEPVSRDVHCFASCRRCGAEFELDDPRLAPAGPSARAREARRA
ncbi:MAG TPA: hypothetical protein VMG99_04525 [Thermoplasmata archaeon]|nr:hypothetical protein [Thermoplasmata archaeon]